VHARAQHVCTRTRTHVHAPHRARVQLNIIILALSLLNEEEAEHRLIELAAAGTRLSAQVCVRAGV
jgi:hypothetical protein